jgi:hypothetical protein
MKILDNRGIILFENVFSQEDVKKINSYLERDRWYYGHGSYYPDNNKFETATFFWGMLFEDEKYFTDYLFNIIKDKTKQDFDLETVYANGHMYGTRGGFHQDSDITTGRTFLYYANQEWYFEWGGKTVFDFGNGEYYYHVPIPNSALYFPGIIKHAAEGTTGLFKGLRKTIAWKLDVRLNI